MDEEAIESRQGHRADIQGLRAIAIVLVVACHTGLALPGGFIGVDVFFVVSGFVIGALLLRELEATGTVSLRTFYARRARRLLPALTAMLLVSLVIGVLVLNPQLEQVGPFRTARLASVFASNGYLYRHLGYFDGDIDQANPFLHLWSLSVEEQFYLVLPVLLLVGWRWGRGRSAASRRRSTAGLVAVASLGSFWLSWAMTTGRSPVALQAPARFAFYSSPTRLWELGVGVLAAFAAVQLGRLPAPARTVGAAVGGMLIVGSAVLIDPLQPFPGLRAVPPVAGTLLVLAAGTGGSSSPITRWLGARPLRWLGDRSYGWYLWHWPAIVYARSLWPESSLVPAVAAAVSLGVAALTYAAFEDRVRRNPTLVGLPALRLASVCIVISLLASTGALRGAERGWGVERPDGWTKQSAGRGAGCLLLNIDLPREWPGEVCTTEPPGRGAVGTVLVLGDNHADAVSTAAIEVAGSRHLRVAQWTRSGCPFVDAVPEAYPECASWQRDALALVRDLDPEVVVVANRSTSYTSDLRAGGATSTVRHLVAPDGTVARSTDDAVALWQRALRTTVERLRARGVAVVVVGGAPLYRTSFPSPSILRPSTEAPVVARAAVDALHDPVVAAERRALRGLELVAYVDPVPVLCRSTCSPVFRGQWRYLDGYDLNQPGSHLLAPALGRAVDGALAGRS